MLLCHVVISSDLLESSDYTLFTWAQSYRLKCILHLSYVFLFFYRIKLDNENIDNAIEKSLCILSPCWLVLTHFPTLLNTTGVTSWNRLPSLLATGTLTQSLSSKPARTHCANILQWMVSNASSWRPMPGPANTTAMSQWWAGSQKAAAVRVSFIFLFLKMRWNYNRRQSAIEESCIGPVAHH